MYYYDYMGNRIFKQSQEFEASPVPGALTQGAYYLRDVDGKEIAVYNTGNSSGWNYYVLGNEREARVMPNYDQQPQQNTTGIALGTHISWLEQYVSDHLGNTRVVYRTEWDATQSQVKYTLQGAYDFFPYGKLLRKYVPGNGIERYLTTQHERDEETISDDNSGTGLDYRINRYYDSDIVRFNSIDKLADHPNQIDKSPYAYVWGNPVMLTDPDGNCPLCPGDYNSFGDFLVGMQIKFSEMSYNPKGDAPSSKGGYTLTTDNPTHSGTTDNAPRQTTYGAEMLNIDAVYYFMSSTSTMNKGTKVFSNHKVFEKIHAVSEGLKTALTAESKAQDINDNRYEGDLISNDGKTIKRPNFEGDTFLLKKEGDNFWYKETIPKSENTDVEQQ